MCEAVRNLAKMPSRVMALTGVTFTQLLRMRLFMVLLVFAAGFMALQFLPYHGQLGVETRGLYQMQLIKDVALGCMQMIGLIFCVGATALLIPRDAEDRILYTILSKPVPRFEYLLGKLLGVWLVLFLMLLLMDFMLMAVLHFREVSISAELVENLSQQGLTEAQMQPYLAQVAEVSNSWNMPRGIVSMYLGFGVLTGFTLLCSTFTSGTIVSMIFGLGAYFVGMFQHQLISGINAGMGEGGAGVVMRWTEQIVAVLLPDFSLFNVSDAASSGTELGWGLLGGLLLIALAYMLLHLLVSTYIFSRKEF